MGIVGNRRRIRTSTTLVFISLLLAACGPAERGPLEPLGSGFKPNGLDVTAFPIEPDFATADVILSVNGVECARQVMSRSASRWIEGGLCSQADNQVDLQFVAPADCRPGGIFLYEGTAVDAEGRVLSYQGRSMAAWDASGQALDVMALDLERRLQLVAHAGTGGDNAASPEASRSWTYQLDFAARGVSPGCSDWLLVSLETTPASAELPQETHEYRIETSVPAEGIDAVMRVARQGAGAPLPSVEVQVDGEWRLASSLPSESPDAVAFRIPAQADAMLRLNFGLDALMAMRVEPRMAYEPRDEIPHPYWFEMAQPVNAFIQVDDSIEMSAEATEALPLAAHLASFFARLTSSMPSDHTPPPTLEVSVAVSFAFAIAPDLPETRVPLVLIPKVPFVKGESDRSDCDAGSSFACEMAAAMRHALDAMGQGAEGGTFVFDLKLLGTTDPSQGAVIDLREVRLPLDRVAWEPPPSP